MNQSRRVQGFTLLEILIVLVIIGIVTTIAVLAFANFGRDRRLRTVVNQFEGVVRLAREDALLRPATLGLQFTKNGFSFYQYWVDAKTHKGRWRSIVNDTLSQPNLFSDDVQCQLLAAQSIQNFQQTGMVSPAIIFLPDGYVTPFKLRFSVKDGRTMTVNVNSNGYVNRDEGKAK